MKWFLFLSSCLAAAVLPCFGVSEGQMRRHDSYEFITTFRGNSLLPVAMTDGEAAFYDDFPGATGYFNIDDRPGESVFLRYVEQPTRKLHAAEGCYRASGYQIEYSDNVQVRVEELSEEPLQWSQFSIREGDCLFWVRQVTLSLTTGASYPDVPAWYWQTMFSSRDPGPWLSVTWKLPAI